MADKKEVLAKVCDRIQTIFNKTHAEISLPNAHQDALVTECLEDIIEAARTELPQHL